MSDRVRRISESHCYYIHDSDLTHCIIQSYRIAEELSVLAGSSAAIYFRCIYMIRKRDAKAIRKDGWLFE
jgi:hypothetical protein